MTNTTSVSLGNSSFLLRGEVQNVQVRICNDHGATMEPPNKGRLLGSPTLSSVEKLSFSRRLKIWERGPEECPL